MALDNIAGINETGISDGEIKAAIFLDLVNIQFHGNSPYEFNNYVKNNSSKLKQLYDTKLINDLVIDSALEVSLSNEASLECSLVFQNVKEYSDFRDYLSNPAYMAHAFVTGRFDDKTAKDIPFRNIGMTCDEFVKTYYDEKLVPNLRSKLLGIKS